jgi:hypothetical protein
MSIVYVVATVFVCLFAMPMVPIYPEDVYDDLSAIKCLYSHSTCSQANYAELMKYKLLIVYVYFGCLLYLLYMALLYHVVTMPTQPMATNAAKTQTQGKAHVE